MSVELVIGLAALVGGPFAAWLGYKGVGRTLKANQPVNEATADEKQALANQVNIKAQKDVIATLERELERQRKTAERLELKVEAVTSKMEEFEHQNEQLADELEQARDAKKLTEQHLTACREQNKILSDTKAVLIETARRQSEWQHRHYATEHPEGDDPPPEFHVL